MDAAQQAAVQAVYTAAGGATLTAAQVTAIGPMVDARNDAGIASCLSTGLTVQGSVSVPTFVAWAASTGLLGVIEAAAANSASPLYNSALAVKAMLAWQGGTLDLSSSAVGQGNQAMLAAWVAGSAITAAQQAALLALATQPVTIPVGAVSNALNGVN